MHLKSAAELLEKRSTTRLYSGLAGSTTLPRFIGITQRVNINAQGSLFRYYLTLINKI